MGRQDTFCVGRRKSKSRLCTYQFDLEISLTDELVQFAFLMRTPLGAQLRDKNASKEINMYNLLIEQDFVSTLPNIEVALRLYLCLMVSNCSGERTFSQLKRIKNELRSTMGQNRLNCLSLMSIECDVVQKIDFTSIVQDFALRKSRKVML